MSYIKKVLMSDEKIIYTTSLSRVLYTPVLLWFFAGFILKYYNIDLPFLKENIKGYPLYDLLSLGCFLFGVLFIINAFIVIHTSEYALTNRRVIAKIGWLRQVSVDILLQKVESVTVRQSLFGRLFNYGTLIVCGTGGSKDPFFKVRHPLEFRNHIQHQAEGTLHDGVSPSAKSE